MKKLPAAAGIVLALVAGSAIAADLPNKKGPVFVPPPPPPMWTGLYGGVNIGYGFGAGSQDQYSMGYIAPWAIPAPLAAVAVLPPVVAFPFGSAGGISQDLNGVIGGGQVGYNHQFNPWLVVGVEADLQASDVHATTTGWGGVQDVFGPHLQTAITTKSVDWYGTVRGRVGVTLPSMPGLLIYGTGGVAYGQVVHNAAFADNFLTPAAAGFAFGTAAKGFYDDTRIGWTAGGGVEWMLGNLNPLLTNFSAKLEYLYTDLGSTTIAVKPFTGGPILAGAQTSPTQFHSVRAGINWHFNPFAAAPVLAKY
jgi:opacity protein-like surface antigen